MKKLFSLILVFFIFGCSGTGTKDYGALLPIKFKDEKYIYIARQTGLVGILGTLEVIHNGNSVAELGHKEIIKIKGLSGENSLKIRGKGLNAMANSKTIKFDIIDNKNKFFVFSIVNKLFGADVVLNEVTKESFLNNIR